MGGISIWQIAIVVVIVVVLFGSKRLGNLGGELGKSIKGFKKAMKDDDKATDNTNIELDKDNASVNSNSSKKQTAKEESKS